MLFSTERVSANNLESFLFTGFLLIFAIAASRYVWVKGIERGLRKSKLLLDCIMIITSVCYDRGGFPGGTLDRVRKYGVNAQELVTTSSTRLLMTT